MSADLTRARMLLEVGRAAEARELLARVLAADPASIQALILVAHASHVLDDHKAQLAAAEELIRLGPEEEIGHRYRALACSQLDRHAEAIQDAREAVRLDPLEYGTHLVLSSVLRSVRDGALRHVMLEEAWDAAMRAVAIAPDVPGTHLEAGLVALSQKEYEVSRAALSRALELDPENTTAMSLLGELRLVRGEETEAAELFRAALNADPKGEPAQHGLTRLARRIIYRPLVLTCVALVPILVLLQADAPVARAVVAGGLVLAAAGLVGWSLRRLEPAVRDWVLRAVRRDRSLAPLALSTLAAFAATVVVGLIPGTHGEPAMITAVLAVGVALWVLLFL